MQARRLMLGLASGLSLAAVVLLTAAPGLGVTPALPNPCASVPPAVVASALGLKTAAGSKLYQVVRTATCSYRSGKLTLFVGYTSIGLPGTVAKSTRVSGLPHGFYNTYTNTVETQVTFYKGPAASAVYGIVTTTGAVSKPNLERIARLLYGSIGDPSVPTLLTPTGSQPTG